MTPRYIELLCSLPYLADPFVHRRPPISEVQLLKRLSMLDFADRELVRELAAAFYWGRIRLDDSDAEIVTRAGRLIERVEPEDLREWLLWRMDIRTLVAALRRRHNGESSAPVALRWGYGRYARYIERNWTHPHFRLESRFPWLPQAKLLLETGESHQLEQLLLSSVWGYYQQQQADEQYSLSEVWLYLMKWDLVERWCSYDADHAREQFDALADMGLEQSLQELRNIA